MVLKTDGLTIIIVTMLNIADQQAKVDPKDIAEEQLGTIRPEGETKESKLIAFILGLTTAQSEWIAHLRSVNWEAEDPKLKTWQLFAEAKVHGIRQSVAYPLVKAVIEAHDVSISPTELAARAYGAYKTQGIHEPQPEARGRAPKSNFTPGMMIPKVRA